MAKTGYSVTTGAAQALTAGVPRTVLGIKSNAAFGVDIQKWAVGFDGSTAGAGIGVELCYCTWATNAPGTASTSVTPAQIYGRALTHGITAARHWTTEPTNLTVIDEKYISPGGGWFEWAIPLGQTVDSALGEGFAIRLTTPAGVTPNYKAAFLYERT
jgi:hypothetical protein